MFAEAIGLSLVGSLLSFELIGLSPGGLIVPGYLALLAGSPVALATIAVATGLVLLSVRGLSSYLILFGRRRFVLMVLVGFVFVKGLEAGSSAIPWGHPEVQGLGYLVPGLIANDMEKQGVVPTILTTILVSGIIRLALTALVGRGWL